MNITKNVPVINRSAWKPITDEPGKIVSCAWDDYKAIEFRIGYIGSYCSTTTLDFKTRYTAEAVEHALHKVFEEGRKQTKRDLNAWLGDR